MRTTIITDTATPAELHGLMEHYCADTVSPTPKGKGKGKVFRWRGRTVVCTGALYRPHGHIGYVELREVTPLDQYTGPHSNTRICGPDFYLGMRFMHKHQLWAMTAIAFDVVPPSDLHQHELPAPATAQPGDLTTVTQ